MAIDDAACAVRLLVEVQNGRFAQVRKAVAECFEVFGRHHVLMLRWIRSPGHSEVHPSIFAICSLQDSLGFSHNRQPNLG